MQKNNNSIKEQDVLETLRDIKKLLVLSLLKKDVSTKDIGTALGVSYKTIERMVPRN